jgi:hypothetical protein
MVKKNHWHLSDLSDQWDRLVTEVSQVQVVISQPGIQELQARSPEITLSIAVAAKGPLNFLLLVLDICPKVGSIIDITRVS